MNREMVLTPAQRIHDAARVIAASPAPIGDWRAHRDTLSGAMIFLPGAQVVEAVTLAARMRRGER